MLIKELVKELEKVEKPPVSKKLTVSKKEVASAIRDVSSNLILVLRELGDKKITENRDDIKFIIKNSALEVPENFSLIEINKGNKKNVINFLIHKKDDVKVRAVRSDFHEELNRIIDAVFSRKKLNEIVGGDARKTYYAIIDVIGVLLGEKYNLSLSALVAAERKSLSINVYNKIGEILSIKMFAPSTSAKPSVPGGSYYIHEPNGKGRYPDYTFYFGKKENKDAKKIREIFNIPKDIKEINIEAKVSARIVGKQTTPKKYKATLDDDALFALLTKLPVGKSKKLRGEQVKKMLIADGIEVEAKVIYVNPAGKTEKTIVKTFMKKIGDTDTFILKRNSKGQYSISDNEKNEIFGIEIGRIAYTTGLFKEDITHVRPS